MTIDWKETLYRTIPVFLSSVVTGLTTIGDSPKTITVVALVITAFIAAWNVFLQINSPSEPVGTTAKSVNWATKLRKIF